MASIRTQSVELPRSTAYYYADLEKLKKTRPPEVQEKDPNELSEYVESNEVVNDGAVREVPPFRDRQWSLPEYNIPENGRKIEETYSTAGTFPMPEPKEKEPLLAELEVVGRLPLTELDSSQGVRRSRSWYLCCPNVADEEMSRESSWRYSSLRPVTAPPAPGQNGFHHVVASSTSGRDDVTALKIERDALARALAAERQRAATAARAHDARLAELHGVIAELVRRRAAHKQSAAIPEEELSDECESTTQPAGELDNDADQSRTEQIDSSSALSPSELPTPQEPAPPAPPSESVDAAEVYIDPVTSSDPSLRLSMASDADQHPARCCNSVERDGCREREGQESVASCERQRGSPSLYAPATPVGCGVRQAKLASRVRLRRATDSHSNNLDSDHTWCAEAERLSREVRAHADLREALAATDADECIWRARWLRSEASLVVVGGALSRCGECARRLHCACAQLEASTASLSHALNAADRALETYDVLLALAETRPNGIQRNAAEAVAWQLLRRLKEHEADAVGSPTLSPGPWLQRDKESEEHAPSPPPPWGAEQETQLRQHAAALKAQTVALRRHAQHPVLYSHHDIDEEDIPTGAGIFSMADMEAAVMLEEMLTVRVSNMERAQQGIEHADHKHESSRSRRRRERQWRHHTSETDL
ncbi:unnamed protein product [Chilo suppressalis]|uniref:Colorectal mutant cancer protein n=1 Tax=Chilo suppressalis TaxID=168631 RepID=A0ABN8B4L0_CHISP|nr:unnamed protein product [Chilo suppressalis]